MRNATILIIEDEEEMAILFTKWLKKKYRHIITCTNLVDGFKACAFYRPNVIIIDNNLPDGQGIDSIKAFKKVSPTCRIFMISAMSDLKLLACKKGADSFFCKPVTMSDIEHKINEMHYPQFE